MSAQRNKSVAGLILAGGQSRRMFGGTSFGGTSGANNTTKDKGLLALGGRPMLGHVLERLAPQVGSLAINANGDGSRFDSFSLPVIADTIDGFAGPLAGVLAGLRWARDATPSARWIATASSDAPLLPGDLVARFVAAVEGRENAIAIASSGGALHPVIGLWPVVLADDLEAALKAGLRKVLHWTDRHGTVPVEFPFIEVAGRSIDPFFNANTPAEFDELETIVGGAARNA